MRVFIAVDIEGISSMVDWRDQSDFEARKWMTEDANAAVRGAFEGGASYVCVRDCHGPARSIIPEALDERAELCRGWDNLHGMVDGVESGFDALMLVGWHARYGTESGVMAHSWSGIIRNVWVNGVEMGEVGLAAVIAGAAGVPIVLVSGDDALAKEAEALLPGVRAATVKHGLNRLAGRCLSPSRARRVIEDTARVAVAERRVAAYGTQWPASIEVRYQHRGQASWAARVPGVRREGDYGITTEVADVAALKDVLFCCNRLAHACDLY